jgi:hypothetical protein
VIAATSGAGVSVTLAGAAVAARRDAGEHALEHDGAQRVAGGEVTVRPERQLALVVCAARAGA